MLDEHQGICSPDPFLVSDKQEHNAQAAQQQQAGQLVARISPLLNHGELVYQPVEQQAFNDHDSPGAQPDIQGKQSTHQSCFAFQLTITVLSRRFSGMYPLSI